MKKKFAKKKAPRIFRIILGLVFFVFVLPLALWGLLVATFDIKAYRQDLADLLSDKTGRVIELAGPVDWDFSWRDGLKVRLADVGIGNPPWASRKIMAHLDALGLHVDFMPIFQRKLRIASIDLDGADIQLETAQDGRNNWTFAPTPVVPAPKSSSSKSRGERNFTFTVEKIDIKDGRFGFKNRDGGLVFLSLDTASFKDDGKAVTLRALGALEGREVDFALSGGPLEKLGRETWPFSALTSLGSLKISFDEGSASRELDFFVIKKIMLLHEGVDSENTDILGSGVLSLKGTRPSFQGAFQSNKINLTAFKVPSEDKASSHRAKEKSAEVQPSQRQRLFSDTSIDFGALKKFDAKVDINIGELIAGPTTLKTVAAKMALADGALDVAPLSALLGDGEITGNAGINAAATPAGLRLDVQAKGADISKVLDLSGLENIVEGRTDISLRLETKGRSPRDLMKSSNGKLDIIMDSGHIEPGFFRTVAGQALELVLPGLGTFANPQINCLAAYYVLQNGLMETKGFLLDTDTTTVQGMGYVDWGSEKLSLLFEPKAKKARTIIPPVIIEGTLLSPSVHVEAQSAVKSIFNLITDGMSNNGTHIPEVVPVVGANACAVALKVAKVTPAAKPKGPILPTGNSLGGVLQGIGDKLMDAIDSQNLFQK